MKVSDFTFDLPEELIAQDPLEDRSRSRLLTLDKNTGEIGHDVFHNIVNYLKPGDCLVLNKTGQCMGNSCKARKKSTSGSKDFFWRWKISWRSH